MTQIFRRLSSLSEAQPDEIVVYIGAAGTGPKALLLKPADAGCCRSLDYLDLEEAVSLARAARDAHGWGLAVLVACGSLSCADWARWLDPRPDDPVAGRQR